MVHLRGQPCRHVPVVRLGQHQRAAHQLHPSIAHRLIRCDPELAALLGRGRLVDARHARGDDGRSRRQVMNLAPALQRQGRAVMAQQIRVQRLQYRQRLEPPQEAAVPGQRLSRWRGHADGRRTQQQRAMSSERTANECQPAPPRGLDSVSEECFWIRIKALASVGAATRLFPKNAGRFRLSLR